MVNRADLVRTILVLVVFVLSAGTGIKKEAATAGPADVLKFRNFSYIDQQCTGIEVFRFLMPVDWQFEGEIRWILDNPAMPSTLPFRVYNTKGKDEFEAFTNHCFFWTTNIGLLSMFPPGTKYFGSIVKLPVNAQTALKKIIIPLERQNYQDLKIISSVDLPELAVALGAGKQAQGFGSSGATGAKMRISYTKNGLEMEEEIYAVVENMTFPVQSMTGTFYNTYWFVDYIFSFKGEKGKLEAQTKNYQTITSSFKINPKWYAKYSNVIEYMAQQQITKIKSIGEFSRMLSQMSDRMRTDQQSQFESRSNVYDKVSEKFSDNTLGIDRYYDPYEERQVELPSGFNHAWCNNNGEYVVTDNPNYNPNVGSNLNWKELERK
jgi:hypothetical protein